MCLLRSRACAVVQAMGVALAVSVQMFFFQAEDGIRDLVRSRGLGDVYKRQGQTNLNPARGFPIIAFRYFAEQRTLKKKGQSMRPVSYTHLTLPTSDLV